MERVFLPKPLPGDPEMPDEEMEESKKRTAPGTAPLIAGSRRCTCMNRAAARMRPCAGEPWLQQGELLVGSSPACLHACMLGLLMVARQSWAAGRTPLIVLSLCFNTWLVASRLRLHGSTLLQSQHVPKPIAGHPTRCMHVHPDRVHRPSAAHVLPTVSASGMHTHRGRLLWVV